MRPNVFIAGFPRCASTYLFNILKQHPDISVSKVKEPNYFNWKYIFFGYPNYRSPFRKNKFSEYLSLFKDEPVRIDSSILASYDHECAQRIYERLGDVKIIFLVRNKETHKQSLYKIMLHNGDIPLISYNTFLKNYQRLINFYTDFEQHIEVFKNQFSHVKKFNLIDRDTKKEIKKILRFLKVPDYKFNYDVDMNSSSKDPPATLLHRIKRRILVKFPFLAKSQWE
ncbi:MAG: sulfotransferase domain-containing protein [Nanoarchaeota archaeon]|nr:sulfotransferase domain-containing protein [Nanoarchaeota archaeon]